MCADHCLGSDDETVQGLKIRTRGHSKGGGIVVDVCYTLPDMGEMEESFFRQPEEALGSLALILIADFNHLDIF